jgi:hypothetical protein
MGYLLDSDVFIQAYKMHYSFAVCPGFWKWIAESNSQGLALPSHRNLKKTVGNLQKTCHTAGE